MTGPGIFSYSTTPASNVAANTGINMDEGMPPAILNNSIRQIQTDIRNQHNDLIWFKYGKGDLDYSPVYASATTFTVAGADVTAVYHIGRPVRAVGSGTGTIYGVITASSFSTNTTVTVEWDSGSLSNETLVISISQASVTGSPVRGPIRFPATQITSSNVNTLDDYEEGSWTPTLLFGGAGTGVTYAASGRQGNYTKIGNRVLATCYFLLTSKGSSTGNATLSGLPFSNNSTAGDYVVAAVMPFSLGTVTNPKAVLAPSGSAMNLYNAVGGTALADTDFTNVSELAISISYRV